MDNPASIAPGDFEITSPGPEATLSPLMVPPMTPAEVYRQLCEYTGPSPARAIAAYHAMVTGQELPPVPGLTWPG